MENIEKEEISFHWRNSPPLLSFPNDSSYPYRYPDKPNGYDYKEAIIEKDYYYKDKKLNDYEKKYNSNNDYPYNKRNYYPDYHPEYRKNIPSIDKKESEDYWKYWKYRFKGDDYNNKDDDYWKYPPPNRSNSDYPSQRYSSKSSDIPDFNSDNYNPLKSSPKIMENSDNYHRTPTSLSPSQPPSKKRPMGSRYAEDYDDYGSTNNPNKTMKLSNNKPENTYSSISHPSNTYNTSSPISNYNKSPNGSLNNNDSSSKNSNDFSRIKNDTFSNSNSFYNSPYNASSTGSSQNKPGNNGNTLPFHNNNNSDEINSNNLNANTGNLKPNMDHNRNSKDPFPVFDSPYFYRNRNNYNDNTNNDKPNSHIHDYYNHKMNSPFSSNRLPPPIQDSPYVGEPLNRNLRQDRLDRRDKGDYLYNFDHGKSFSNGHSYQLPSLDDLSSDNSKKENNGQINGEKRSPFNKMKISNLLFDPTPSSAPTLLSNINSC
ncbi:hypothetical protein PIROE2DRAFT_18317 [Piromyces sp. E2]|nr:hypothetical protein PIROE2DRAFT_18317 [Piromyces sp. E2]|eukprot:OUM56876.1 hypothetical protein PIROE2DRAFT_18317 [Piromyces sp. E2]